MWIYILILVLPSTGQWSTLWAERGARKFLAWYALVLLGLLYLKLIAVINGDPITVNTSNKINIL